MNMRIVKEVFPNYLLRYLFQPEFLSNARCVIDFTCHIKGNFTCFIAVLTLFFVKTVKLGRNKTKLNSLDRFGYSVLYCVPYCYVCT